MRTPADVRIQWLHDELVHRTFPNATHLAERFHISARQAQRDIEYLKTQYGAPICYDRHRRGYYYDAPFSLPVMVAGENDTMFARTAHESPFAFDNTGMPEADHLIIQSQIPYTATLAISDKLTVLEMRSYIVAEEKRGQFLCEFHNTDRFLCAIMAARAGIRIVEPAWLREKLIAMAEKALSHNQDSYEKR
jgi:predicted DNA-binding transcriptional regulator YafY